MKTTLSGCFLANWKCTCVEAKNVPSDHAATQTPLFWAGRRFFCATNKVENKLDTLSSTERLFEEYKNGTIRAVVHAQMFSGTALKRHLQMAPRRLLQSLVRPTQWHRRLWPIYCPLHESNGRKTLSLRLLAWLAPISAIQSNRLHQICRSRLW